MEQMTGQPKPKVALNNECSAIYNNTLYTYQVDAFQTLQLELGGEWKELDQGESLTGAICVNVDSADDSQDALWIVGGTGGSTNYTGLQRYVYSTGKWETITPVTEVTKNRINHGAVYLSGPNSIVVYAGSQDGDGNPSTQTFSITTTEPYPVLAYESDGAPPTTRPIVLRWSDTEAVMVGGSASNTQVMLFEPGVGWVNSGATLASPLKTGTDSWHATLVTGNDGSKSLYTYDMTVAPNVANRTLIVDTHGAPIVNAVAVSRRWEEDRDTQRRDLTATAWPTYNNTYASSAIRSTSALAQSSDGTVVLSGGNMDDVICVFNENTNSWVNATTLLVAGDDQKPLHASVYSSTTTSPASTATSPSSEGTPAAESTAAAAAGSPSSGNGSSSASSGLGTNQILGVVLGCIGGAIVLLVLLYCQIRRRKRREDFIRAGHARRASGSAGEPEKDGMAMATDSFPRSPTNPTFMRGHHPQGSHASFSSMAILMGKGPKSSMEGGRRPSLGRQAADGNQQFKSQISNPMPAIAGPMPPLPAYGPNSPRDEKSGVMFTADTVEPRAVPRIPAAEQDGMRRSSGWNRYWSGDSAALNILGYGNNTKRNTAASEGSHYSTNGPAVDPRNRRTQDSATVPPLNVDGRPRFSRVNSGSPTVSTFSAGHRAMSGEIDHRPHSQASDLSGYSSGIPASVQDTWDPTALSSRPFAGGRATSSMYSASNLPIVSAGERPPLPRNVPSGISQQPQLDKAHTSDMSWLNLRN